MSSGRSQKKSPLETSTPKKKSSSKSRSPLDAASPRPPQEKERRHRSKDKDSEGRRKHRSSETEEERRARKKAERQARKDAEESGDGHRSRRSRDDNGTSTSDKVRNSDDRSKREKRSKDKTRDGDDVIDHHRSSRSDETKEERRERKRKEERRRRKAEESSTREDGSRRRKHDDNGESEKRSRKDRDKEKERRRRKHHEEGDGESRRRETDEEKERRRRRKHDGDDDKANKHRDKDKERRRKEEDNETHDERSSRKKHNKNKTATPKHKLDDQSESKKASQAKEEKEIEQDIEETYDYDDDFEDYEDDFEEVDEEENEGSGSNDDDDDDDDDDVDDDVDDRIESARLPDSTSHQGSEEMNLTSSIQQDHPQQEMVRPKSVRPRTAVSSRTLQELKAAMASENSDSVHQQPSSSPSQSYSMSSSSHSRSHHQLQGRPQTRMDFRRAAKKVNNAAISKAVQRARALDDMIQLETTSFDIIDLPPQSKYDRFLQNYSTAQVQHTAVQNAPEKEVQECQTEDIEQAESWTQIPAKSVVASETISLTPTPPSESQKKSSVQSTLLPNEVHQLETFVERAGNACLALLRQQNPDTNASMNEMKIASKLSLLAGRTAVCSSYGMNGQFLTIGYSSPVIQSKDAFKGLLCVWNLLEPSTPWRVLICHENPILCWMDTQSGTNVVAACEDGTLCAWDIDEASRNHIKSPQDDFFLRLPSFSTSGIPHLSFHRCPIIALESASSQTQTQGRIIVSLDENFVLCTWSFVRNDHNDTAGSIQDLGLRPGSQFGLTLVSALQITPRRDKTIDLNRIEIDEGGFCHEYEDMDEQACCATLCQKTNTLFIGTNTGIIVRKHRSGLSTTPRYFPCPSDHDCPCITVDISDQNQFLLAGYLDGGFALFENASAIPLHSFSNLTSTPHMTLKWMNPNTFACVILSTSDLDIWSCSDLTSKQHHQVLRTDENKGSAIVHVNIIPSQIPGERKLVTCTKAGLMTVRTLLNLSSPSGHNNNLDILNQLQTFSWNRQMFQT